jgi:SAM-dependent methyltransferase
MVFSVDVIHHLEHKDLYIQEAVRILRSAGIFCTVTENEELIRNRIPLTSYFPETVSKELERYPHAGWLTKALQSSGFTQVKEEIVHQPYHIRDLGPFETKAFSVLRIIPESAWLRGLARMRADLEHGPIQAVSHYLLVWGVKE